MRLFVLVLISALVLMGCDSKNISDLPASNAQKTINDMALNQSGWAAPWVMWFDKAGTGYINATNGISETRVDPAWVKLTKVDSNAFDVDIEHSAWVWKKTESDATEPGSKVDAQIVHNISNSEPPANPDTTKIEK